MFGEGLWDFLSCFYIVERGDSLMCFLNMMCNGENQIKSHMIEILKIRCNAPSKKRTLAW